MSQVSEKLRVLERLAEAFNDHDLDRIMELFAEDCSLDMPRGSAPWGTRYVGKAAVREGLQTRFEILPDVHYGDVRHFATERMGVSEWLVAGTLRWGRLLRRGVAIAGKAYSTVSQLREVVAPAAMRARSTDTLSGRFS